MATEYRVEFEDGTRNYGDKSQVIYTAYTYGGKIQKREVTDWQDA